VAIPKRERLIRRYEHHYFTGWVVAVKRRGDRWVRYFSDKPHGRGAALQAARAFRESLLATLPPPTKAKRQYSRNTTGVVGVARVKERTRAGRPFCRYVASWPRLDGRVGRATFSIAKHGEAKARRNAIRARNAGLAELGL
jgi:AP2 domain